ncbi:MAG: formylglycine-generating enzyme family protein, partial [Chitinophagia bacterium]|nr:formylglycine-generating enzyme family protein [Chitinophagia bacterium]
KSNTNGVVRVVGLKKPNELGIYDMTGNVLEYCQDWFDNHYYRYSPKDNPRGPADGKYRVSRGGGVLSTAAESRTKDRHWDDPTTKMNYNGFRVVVED